MVKVWTVWDTQDKSFPTRKAAHAYILGKLRERGYSRVEGNYITHRAWGVRLYISLRKRYYTETVAVMYPKENRT